MTECKYSKDCPNSNTEACTSLCPYYIILHGASGKGGYWDRSNVPKKYRNDTADNLYEGKAFDTIRKYIEKIPSVIDKGTGLYLFSVPTQDNPFGTGVGKTYSASIIANEFLLKECKRITKQEVSYKYNPLLFVKSSDFQNKYNSQFRGSNDMQKQASVDYYNYKQLMKHTKLLVIDDIATRTGTEAFINELYEIIDHRATEELATIFTSNIPLDKLSTYLDDRLVSRIDGMTVQIPFKDKDHRKKTF